MPHKPKASKKPYSAPSVRRLAANKAKAVLETKAVPADVGARAMLNSISNSKGDLRKKTTESTLQLLERPIR
jgi:hypothetical protein